MLTSIVTRGALRSRENTGTSDRRRLDGRRIVVHRWQRPPSGAHPRLIRMHLSSREPNTNEPLADCSPQPAASNVVDEHQPPHSSCPNSLNGLAVRGVRHEQPSLHLHVRAGARLRQLVNMVFQHLNDDVAALFRVCPFPREPLRTSERQLVLRVRRGFHTPGRRHRKESLRGVTQLSEKSLKLASLTLRAGRRHAAAPQSDSFAVTTGKV